MSPSVTLLGKPRPAFQVCGYIGLILAFVQSSVLVAYLGLSQLTLFGMTGVVILTFLGLTMITKIIVGHELIIYYHHEIAVIVMVTVFLRVTGQPALPYLEGVRLFPIQSVESGFALLIVVTGIVAIIEGYPPGTAFTFYVLVYAAGRFCFEFFRGDSTRPYLWGFSEAQWISLSIAMADLWAERAGLVPSYGWHGIVPLLMLTAMLAIGLKIHFEQPSRFALLHPRHIRELAEAVQLLKGALDPLQFRLSRRSESGSNVIHVANTSLGCRISTGEVKRGSHSIRHYSLSHDSEPLSASSARLLATTIGCLHHPSSPFELVAGESGVFHVMFGPDRARSTSRVRSGNRTRVLRSRTSVRAEGLHGTGEHRCSATVRFIRTAAAACRQSMGPASADCRQSGDDPLVAVWCAPRRSAIQAPS